MYIGFNVWKVFVIGDKEYLVVKDYRLDGNTKYGVRVYNAAGNNYARYYENIKARNDFYDFITLANIFEISQEVDKKISQEVDKIISHG